MLDLFFSGYLNRICEYLSKEYLGENNAEISNLFYILYSGGDDVFIIAPWDKTLDVALEIRNKFDKLTGNNKNLSISAGYIQTKPKFTIRLSANYSKEAESVAKESGKNRIVAFGDVLKWDRMESVKNVSNYLAEKINEKQLQRGFIYSLYTLREQFLNDTKARRSPVVYPYSNEVNLMFYPYFHYYVARNIKEKEEIIKLFFNNLGWKDFSKIKDGISFLINYTALKTRNRED
jgi:CRISPR-associated protein Csm1